MSSLRITMVLLLMGLLSCKKDKENIVDCFGESLLAHVSATADSDNTRSFNYSVHYSGDHTIKSIAWDFGDGEKVTTQTTTTQHAYDNAGTFAVKADLT